MEEREQVIQAREQLQVSMKNVYRDLKIYGKAIISRNNEVLRKVSNSVVEAYEKFNIERQEKKLKKKDRHQSKEQKD